MASRVADWLAAAGLSRHARAFAGMPEGQFLGMMMQDYARFGVVEQGDRRVLHRLIREVRAQIEQDELEALGGAGGGSPSPAPAPAAAGGRSRAATNTAATAEEQLLDLDEHDGDLLQHHGAFALSPISEGAAAAAAAAAAASASAAAAAVTAARAPLPTTTTTTTAADPNTTTTAIDNDPFGPYPSDPPKIRVVVRKRPINRRELERGDEDVVEVLAPEGAGAGDGSADPSSLSTLLNRGRIAVHESKLRVDLVRYVDRHAFTFDAALDERVTNEQVYSLTVRPLVATLLTGGKATCFAYGQTGSGKTHTMSPLPIRAAQDVLGLLSKPQHADVRLHLACFEIYGNRCFDLLNGRAKLSALEDAKRQVVVVGLREAEVSSVAQVEELIAAAHSQRSTGSTAANADSSRSHCIMQFSLKKPNPFYSGGVLYGAAAAAAASGGNSGANAANLEQQQQFLAVPATSADKVCVVGKISFIDLAGSERGADTYDNNRQTRMEGAEINKSLLALKECIRALDSDARHVPFRGSKLTAVLRDSFVGGNARTVMVANISPTSSCVEHTLNTLRYADRVKELRKAAKGERTRGGVTPGDGDYYASVERGLAGPAGGAGAAGAAAAGVSSSSVAPPVSSASALPPLQPPQPGVMAMGAGAAAVPPVVRAGSRRASVAGGEGAGALAAAPVAARGGSFSGRPSAAAAASSGAASSSLLAPKVVAASSGRPSLAPQQHQQQHQQQRRASAIPAAAAAPAPPAAAAGGRYGGASSAAAMAAAAAAAADDFFDDEEEQERALRELEEAEGAAARQHQHQHPPTRQAPAPPADDAPDDNGARDNTIATAQIPTTAAQRAALSRRRNALMEAILEDEEEIVALHRRQIEEAMDVVRREMGILAEVDRPGSAIDAYVDALEEVLEAKTASIRQLQRRLQEFRAKLREEERMSAAMKAASAAGAAGLGAAAGAAGPAGPGPAAAAAEGAGAAGGGKRERVGRALGRLVGRV